MTPKEAAEWIAAEVRAQEYLDHAQVIEHLIDTDEALIAYSDSGNPAVSKAVLKAFRDLRPDDIVWSRSEQHWRLRENGDEDGRMAP